MRILVGFGGEGEVSVFVEGSDGLWGAYGALGYEGIDGERARKVVECMERVLGELESKAQARFEENR